MTRVLRNGLLLWALVTAAGCAEAGNGGGGGGPVDAGQIIRPDARPQLPTPDAATNQPDAAANQPDAAANVPDAAVNRPDARIISDARPDAMPDAMPVDAYFEADAEPGSVVIKSASITLPNTNGLNVTSNVWLGWRFEVTAAINTTRVGFFTNGSTGTAFATIVRLDNGTDDPDSTDLTTGDVLIAPVSFTLPSGQGDIAVPLSLNLQPGWYAVVFGTSAFGTSSTDSTLAARGNTMIAGAQNPFLLVQSTSTLLESSSDGMRFYVEGTPE